MGDWPPDLAVPVTIWTGSKYAITVAGREITATQPPWGTLAHGTANLALFVPTAIPFRYPVRKLFIYNGATVAGNVDVGIYSEDLNKVYSSGSVTQAGASATQFFPAAGSADQILDPGLYYLAMASNSTTAMFGGQALGTASRLRYFGLFQQSVFPLPALATPAAMATLARLPMIGITALASPTF